MMMLPATDEAVAVLVVRRQLFCTRARSPHTLIVAPLPPATQPAYSAPPRRSDARAPSPRTAAAARPSGGSSYSARVRAADVLVGMSGYMSAHLALRAAAPAARQPRVDGVRASGTRAAGVRPARQFVRAVPPPSAAEVAAARAAEQAAIVAAAHAAAAHAAAAQDAAQAAATRARAERDTVGAALGAAKAAEAHALAEAARLGVALDESRRALAASIQTREAAEAATAALVAEGAALRTRLDAAASLVAARDDALGRRDDELAALRRAHDEAALRLARAQAAERQLRAYARGQRDAADAAAEVAVGEAGAHVLVLTTAAGGAEPARRFGSGVGAEPSGGGGGGAECERAVAWLGGSAGARTLSFRASGSGYARTATITLESARLLLALDAADPIAGAEARALEEAGAASWLCVALVHAPPHARAQRLCFAPVAGAAADANGAAADADARAAAAARWLAALAAALRAEARGRPAHAPALRLGRTIGGRAALLWRRMRAALGDGARARGVRRGTLLVLARAFGAAVDSAAARRLGEARAAGGHARAETLTLWLDVLNFQLGEGSALTAAAFWVCAVRRLQRAVELRARAGGGGSGGGGLGGPGPVANARAGCGWRGGGGAAVDLTPAEEAAMLARCVFGYDRARERGADGGAGARPRLHWQWHDNLAAMLGPHARAGLDAPTEPSDGALSGEAAAALAAAAAARAGADADADADGGGREPPSNVLANMRLLLCSAPVELDAALCACATPIDLGPPAAADARPSPPTPALAVCALGGGGGRRGADAADTDADADADADASFVERAAAVAARPTASRAWIVPARAVAAIEAALKRARATRPLALAALAPAASDADGAAAPVTPAPPAAALSDGAARGVPRAELVRWRDRVNHTLSRLQLPPLSTGAERVLARWRRALATRARPTVTLALGGACAPLPFLVVCAGTTVRFELAPAAAAAAATYEVDVEGRVAGRVAAGRAFALETEAEGGSCELRFELRRVGAAGLDGAPHVGLLRVERPSAILSQRGDVVAAGGRLELGRPLVAAARAHARAAYLGGWGPTAAFEAKLRAADTDAAQESARARALDRMLCEQRATPRARGDDDVDADRASDAGGGRSGGGVEGGGGSTVRRRLAGSRLALAPSPAQYHLRLPAQGSSPARGLARAREAREAAGAAVASAGRQRVAPALSGGRGNGAHTPSGSRARASPAAAVAPPSARKGETPWHTPLAPAAAALAVSAGPSAAALTAPAAGPSPAAATDRPRSAAARRSQPRVDAVAAGAEARAALLFAIAAADDDDACAAAAAEPSAPSPARGTATAAFGTAAAAIAASAVDDAVETDAAAGVAVGAAHAALADAAALQTAAPALVRFAAAAQRALDTLAVGGDDLRPPPRACAEAMGALRAAAEAALGALGADAAARGAATLAALGALGASRTQPPTPTQIVGLARSLAHERAATAAAVSIEADALGQASLVAAQMRELLGAPAGSADARASQAVRARARRLRRPWLSSAWTLLDALAEVEVDDGAAAGREGAGAAAARLRAVDVALSGGEASLFEAFEALTAGGARVVAPRVQLLPAAATPPPAAERAAPPAAPTLKSPPPDASAARTRLATSPRSAPAAAGAENAPPVGESPSRRLLRLRQSLGDQRAALEKRRSARRLSVGGTRQPLGAVSGDLVVNCQAHGQERSCV